MMNGFQQNRMRVERTEGNSQQGFNGGAHPHWQQLSNSCTNISLNSNNPA